MLLHGSSASLHTWEGWPAALRATRRVVSFDRPGFGLTGPNASGDYSEAMYLRFVLGMLDALKLQRVVLGGNSLAGAIAWEVAPAAPDHVLPRSAVEDSVRSVYGQPGRVTPERLDRYAAMTRREGNRRAPGQRMAQINRGQNAAGIATFKVPTLILWGGQDRRIPPDNAARFGRDIKGSALVMFDGLGHVPQEEDPQRTVAAVQRFLAVQR